MDVGCDASFSLWLPLSTYYLPGTVLSTGWVVCAAISQRLCPQPPGATEWTARMCGTLVVKVGISKKNLTQCLLGDWFKSLFCCRGDKAPVESQIPSQTHTLYFLGERSCQLLWLGLETIETECAIQIRALCEGCRHNKGDSVNPRHPHRAGQGWQRAIHATSAAALLCGLQEEAAGLRAFVAQGAGGWNMTHLCFLALFSSKPRKWNGLRGRETVVQAVSGRLVLASHRT